MLGGGEGQQLIRSDKAKSGYKGVTVNDGRYQAECDTPPCSSNHLGTFDTPEDAARSYLQHHQQQHEHEAELKDVKPLAEEEEEEEEGLEAAVQCSICSDTMKQASTLSGCGHTFCRGCIEEAVRVKGCCPVCHQPVPRPAAECDG